MNELDKIFIKGNVLQATELNELVGKINELVKSLVSLESRVKKLESADSGIDEPGFIRLLKKYIDNDTVYWDETNQVVKAKCSNVPPPIPEDVGFPYTFDLKLA